MKPLLNTLFVTTQESYLAKDGECVAVYQGDTLKGKVPIHTLGGLVLFGQISCSPFLLGHCAENGVTVSWLTLLVTTGSVQPPLGQRTPLLLLLLAGIVSTIR